MKYAPERSTTPTLFIHSEQRLTRCWLSEGLSMFAALKTATAAPTTICVLFHGENHELSRSGKPHEPHPPDEGDRGLVRPLSEVTQPLIYRRREGLPRPSLRLSIQTDE